MLDLSHKQAVLLNSCMVYMIRSAGKVCAWCVVLHSRVIENHIVI